MKNYEYNMKTEVKTYAKEHAEKFCKWAVCFTIPAETQDDRTEKYSTVAVFEDPYLAEDFIDTVLPHDERKDRFFITRFD
jgi:hypothetical protein